MIALGSDHGGYDLKCQIEEYLEEKGYEYQDFDVLIGNPVIIRTLERQPQERLQTDSVIVVL